MIGTCENCDRENVPVSNCRMSGMESTQCFLCQGEADPDPYGEREDHRIQAHLKRSLVVTLTDAIAAAIECGGLNPDNALNAVQEVWESEQRLAGTRKAFARTYV